MNPSTFKGLELRELLGEGGMGRVYRAFDPGLQREVALKVMRSPLDAEQRARFSREIELTATVRHPGIVTVHEAGVASDGKPYLILELVEDARSLTEAMRELTVGERVELISELADAVASLHARGVVHRDLKPGNVLVDRDGRTRLCDLGLARHVEERQRLTQTGALLGTPLYMAPEQFRGSADGKDARVDVWALGVLLYEAISGKHPFANVGVTLQELMARIQKRPAPPRDPAGDLSPAVGQMCLRALEPDPNRRLNDAAAFREELEAALSGAGPRRWPLVAASGAGALIVLAVALWPGDRVDAPEPVKPSLPPAPSEPSLPPSEPTVETDPVALYNQAGVAEREGRLEDAREAIDAALALRPDHVQSLFLRAGIRARQGDLDGAESDFGRVIELDPKHGSAWSARGALRWKRGDQGAVFDLNRGVELDPSSASALENRALVRRDLGDHPGAMRDANRAIELSPHRGSLYNLRGLLYRDGGLLREAMDDHTQAIACEPENSLGYVNRGGAKLGLGDLEGAWRDFAKAIELNPKDSMAYANRGVIKGKRGELLSALRDFDKSIELAPQAVLGYQNRAHAKRLLGDLPGAIRDYDTARELAKTPQDQAAFRSLAEEVEAELRRRDRQGSGR